MLLGVIEHHNERVGRVEIPLTQMSRFYGACRARVTVYETETIRRFNLKLNPSILDLSGAWVKMRH